MRRVELEPALSETIVAVALHAKHDAQVDPRKTLLDVALLRSPVMFRKSRYDFVSSG